ncbi:peptide deformylase [Methylobacterium planeticum]|uniref:Peptide deformylase-like n=1 Tax=Methylobacterium planeticum TaxID=2615211 RepID=A0A6N6MS15_9HYPH|nr:peptide deformylase [Methylobacterium planeticum]KAB1074337.1 peptide deformylase [Methylobacterium planeticum]
MPARPLIYFPDPRLRARAEPVLVFDEALRELALDIRDTLDAAQAVGLTAPHIGRPLRLVVLRLEPGAPHHVYVNPEIVWASPERAAGTEGSVLMPGVAETVERARAVRIRYRDLAGAEREDEAEGFRAACLQHEIDQLDGIFWLERLSRLRRERALKRYAKLRRDARPEAP